jgi:hypothetical protein
VQCAGPGQPEKELRAAKKYDKINLEAKLAIRNHIHPRKTNMQLAGQVASTDICC